MNILCVLIVITLVSGCKTLETSAQDPNLMCCTWGNNQHP